MKRLIKKMIKICEFHDSAKDPWGEDKIYDCYKNPTSKEWSEIEKQSPHGGVRCLIFKDGAVYAWVSEIAHHFAINIFKLPNGGEHIDGDKSDIKHLCTQDYTNPESLQECFKNCSSLYNYFSDGTKVNVSTYCNGTKDFPEYKEFATIGNIINAKILTPV